MHISSPAATVTIRALNARDGSPMQGATITFSDALFEQDSDHVPSTAGPTDADGRVLLPPIDRVPFYERQNISVTGHANVIFGVNVFWECE